MQTKLTELLKIKYPILQGGMAWCSEAELVAAVSNSGGAGIIAASGRTTEWLQKEIRKTRTLTDKPFGVNIMLQAQNIMEITGVICREKVDFVTTGAGNPLLVMDKLKTAGIKVIPVVPNVKLAQRMADNKADAIIIEGMESGGHIGQQTTMALMENVLGNVKSIPVIVAGGISDGRAMAAALLMGAAGVQIGSRFLLTNESNIHPAAKALIMAATDTDSVTTGYSRNHGVRCLRNKFTDKYLQRETQGAPDQELIELGTGTNYKGLIKGDIENGTIMVGQALNVLKEIKPVAQVIEDLMAECTATLKKAETLLQ
ncbi:MAG: nitronate monooxygenase [Acidaminococcaceae bacterium]|nr:nitronate monooxygenase [Acidaminococcaceae bacterium]